MKIFDRWRRSVGATLEPNRARSSMGWGKRILVIGVFGSICLVFVFLDIGPGQFASFGLGGSAAQVNSKIISIRDYRDHLQRLEEQAGSSISTERRGQLRRQALENLVNLELLSQRARQVGLRASSEAVGDRIYEIPAFQQEGRFRRNLYDLYLKTTRIRTKDFEARVAGELNINNLQSVMTKSLYEPTMVSDLRKTRGAVFIELQKLQFGIDELVPKKKTLPKKDQEQNQTEKAKPEDTAAEKTSTTAQTAQPTAEAAAAEKAASEKEVAEKAAQEAENQQRQKQFTALVAELKSQLSEAQGRDKAASGEGTAQADAAQSDTAEADTAKVDATQRARAAEKAKAVLQSFARKWKLKWQDEREFSLSTPFLPPDLDEEGLQNLLATGTPVLKQQGSQVFVFVLKKTSQKPDTGSQLAFDFLAMRANNEVFEAWLKAEKEKASIIYNQKLLN